MNPLLARSLRLLSHDRLSVFLFHALPATSPAVPEDFTLGQFQETLHFIRQQFKVVPLDEAVKAMQRGRIEAGTACLTFDDGYPNWVSGVAPLLRDAGLHATFYITTGQFAGRPMWHVRIAQAINAFPGASLHIPGFGLSPLPVADLAQRRTAYATVEQFLKYQAVEEREVLLNQLEMLAGVSASSVDSMTTNQLKELANMGFSIGAHTRSHPILTLCDRRQAIEEIGAVREELRDLLNVPVDSFAYPNGRPLTDFSADHVAMVKAAGYKHAVTTHWGAAKPRTSPFEIPRFTPWGPTPSRMALQMARNMLTRPRTVGSSTRFRPVKVMLVENGAGFGGAVVALKSLVGSIRPEEATVSIVTNIPIEGLEPSGALTRVDVLPDRVVDTRRLAAHVHAGWPTWLRTAVLFGIGRIDDAVNRLPYLVRLGWRVALSRPDIVHGNNEPNSNREAMLVAYLLGIPFVQHVRGPLTPTRIEPWLMSAPSAFVPVSRWLAGELMARGAPSHRIRQIYDGVDMKAPTHVASLELRPHLGLTHDTIIVALVGMLVPWKGHALFIEAVSRMGNRDRPVAFLFFGDTPEHGDPGYAHRLKDQAVQLGVADRVYFMGRHANLRALLPQVNVMVSASTEPEPLGLVMIEAMANGCLFVAPAFGAAVEVISDGSTGLLFEPRNADSLAAVIAVAIARPNGDSTVVEAARRRVIEEFSTDQCRDRTLRVYGMLHGAE